eukprot:3885591-Prymnesium_polylepis.2
MSLAGSEPFFQHSQCFVLLDCTVSVHGGDPSFDRFHPQPLCFPLTRALTHPSEACHIRPGDLCVHYRGRIFEFWT